MLCCQFLCHVLKAVFIITIDLKLSYFCKKMQNFLALGAESPHTPNTAPPHCEFLASCLAKCDLSGVKIAIFAAKSQKSPTAGGSAPSATRLSCNGLFSTGPKLVNFCAKYIFFDSSSLSLSKTLVALRDLSTVRYGITVRYFLVNFGTVRKYGIIFSVPYSFRT